MASKSNENYLGGGDGVEQPPPSYGSSMAEIQNTAQHAGGRYMPPDVSSTQKDSVNFFAMYGYNGNISLAKGSDPHEVYGTMEKLRQIQSGRSNFNPRKATAAYVAQRNVDDPADEVNHIPAPPPLAETRDASCNFCQKPGDSAMVRKISELKIDVCKGCLKQHWKSDFEDFWANNDPGRKR